MSELRELYQEVILDHNKQPRNFRKMENSTSQAEGYNPLCGDQLMVFLQMNGDTISDISFLGSGCAISKASASMMTWSLKGKTKAQAEKTFEDFHSLITGQPQAAAKEDLGKLTVFSGVSEYPSRVKCASLAWHTMRSALERKGETVTTEKEDI